MAMEEASGYCQGCEQQVLIRRKGINHLLHLLLSVFTAGIWLVVWILTGLLRQPWLCSSCGRKVRKGERREPSYTGGSRNRGASYPPALYETRSEKRTTLLIGVGITAFVVAVIVALFALQPHAATPSGGDPAPTALAASIGAPAADTPTDVPADTPTPDPGAQKGEVHICTFANYSASDARCLQDDTSVDLTAQDQARVVWPTSLNGTDATTIQVLQQDGTGTWQVTNSMAVPGDAATSADGSHATYTVQGITLGSNVNSHCNAPYLIRVVNADNHQLGQAPLTTSC